MADKVATHLYFVTTFFGFDELDLGLEGFHPDWFCPCFNDRDEALRWAEEFAGAQIFEVPIYMTVDPIIN